MNRFYLVGCMLWLLESVSGMQLSVTILNDTDQKVILKDFNLPYSSIDIGPRKIEGGSKLKFGITPIAGNEEESFHIVVGKSIIPIVLTWIRDKGIGPFIQQQDTQFRALKSCVSSSGIQIRVVDKSKLLTKKQVQERTQQCSDLQDLSEQTGFTQEELQALQ